MDREYICKSCMPYGGAPCVIQTDGEVVPTHCPCTDSSKPFAEWEECKQTPKTLEAENARLKKALQTISSGIGGDLLGTTSLSREEMQNIAANA